MALLRSPSHPLSHQQESMKLVPQPIMQQETVERKPKTNIRQAVLTREQLNNNYSTSQLFRSLTSTLGQIQLRE
jgi:hypothetical protein